MGIGQPELHARRTLRLVARLPMGASSTDWVLALGQALGGTNDLEDEVQQRSLLYQRGLFFLLG
jgi:hypothetical protein